MRYFWGKNFGYSDDILYPQFDRNVRVRDNELTYEPSLINELTILGKYLVANVPKKSDDF